MKPCILLFVPVLFLILVSLPGLVSAQTAPSTVLIFENTYENGWGNDMKFHTTCSENPNRYSIVNSPAGDGSKVARVYNDGTIPCRELGGEMKHRAEIRSTGQYPGGNETNESYWFGWRVFVPNDYPTSAQESGQVITMQLIGGGYGPEFTINLSAGSKWNITRDWSTGPGDTGNEYTFKSLPVERGVWTDWVVHHKRSWINGQGLTQVWKNGELVVSSTLPWAINYVGLNKGLGNISFTNGIYWGTANRNVKYNLYFDNMRVAKGANGYSLVDPSNGSRGVVTTPLSACADNIDNDNDGFTDYPADTDCSSSSDDSESSSQPSSESGFSTGNSSAKPVSTIGANAFFQTYPYRITKMTSTIDTMIENVENDTAYSESVKTTIVATLESIRETFVELITANATPFDKFGVDSTITDVTFNVGKNSISGTMISDKDETLSFAVEPKSDDGISWMRRGDYDVSYTLVKGSAVLESERSEATTIGIRNELDRILATTDDYEGIGDVLGHPEEQFILRFSNFILENDSWASGNGGFSLFSWSDECELYTDEIDALTAVLSHISAGRNFASGLVIKGLVKRVGLGDDECYRAGPFF